MFPPQAKLGVSTQGAVSSHKAGVKASVLAIAPLYLPYPGGGEKSTHEMLRRLAGINFRTEALIPATSYFAPQRHGETVMDGVIVRHLNSEEWFEAFRHSARAAELIFYTLGPMFRVQFAMRVDRFLRQHRDRVAYFVRGFHPGDYFPGALLVANSREVMASIPDRTGVRKILLLPPIGPPTLRPGTVRRYVTLINPADYKGGTLFLELARRMPEVSFLAQLGRSLPVPNLNLMPNIIVRAPAPDLSHVYAETRVLLMPSVKEPFGRVAIEGALAGCLLLLHRAGGLREVPVPEFCFIDGLEVDIWQRRISGLLQADDAATSELSGEIYRMAQSYDEGWGDFLEALRLLLHARDKNG
jgi:hypothetical protein